MLRRIRPWLLAAGLLPCHVQAQDELAPVTRTYALTKVNIVQAPGRKIEMGTLVLKNGLIHAVGKDVAIPPDAIVLKADSMYVYAGFIDGLSRVGVTKPKEENRERPKDPGNPPPDRAGINPQVEVRGFLSPADKTVEDLRQLGFTVAQVVPHGNLLAGQAAVVLLGGSSADKMLLANRSALYSELSGASNVYPATIIGVMAKWRDLYRQAVQAKNYESLYASNRVGLERPVSDKILEAFYPVIDQRQPVLFKAEKILDVQRVLTLRSDLGFTLHLADVKEAWPMIDKVKATGAKVFLSLDLPAEEKKTDAKKADKPKSPGDIEAEALAKRKAEAVANYTAQAAQFQKAGVAFGFSTLSAKTKDIHANLRRMIAAGLPEDAALAALTTTPAQMLGLADRLGSIDAGKMANLVVSDKPYFTEKAKVRYVFVDGLLYTLETKEAPKGGAKVSVAGGWNYSADTPQGANSGKITIKDDNGNLSGTISSATTKETELKNVSVEGNVLSFSYSVEFGSNTLNIDVTVTIDGDTFEGSMTAGRFGSFPMKGTRIPK
jgi:hypothetical protein